MEVFSGFSKLDREQRIHYLTGHTRLNPEEGRLLHAYDGHGEEYQAAFGDMIENYIGNFPVPMGVVNNMVINGEPLVVPFVTEESSVVAAASKAAKFWATRGGFRAVVTSVIKKGQVHFTWNGEPSGIRTLFPAIREKLLRASDGLTEKMRQRGGGITAIQLIDKTGEMAGYYQLDVSFETAEAMGANFINSCLETLASVLEILPELNSEQHRVEVIMAILSNYTPESIVKCHLECDVEELGHWDPNLPGRVLAKKFSRAVEIAGIDISRAVTHNKGIFNGIDAVMVASGNDWRAVAASGHAYASRDGKYKGLTSISLTDNIFRYELELPLAVGTVGGITRIHTVVKKAMAMMNHPDARQLMMIAAASGLASNFSAVASLVTTGIQKGHMRLHLTNMLNQLNAGKTEREKAIRHFDGVTVSYSLVREFISQIRNEK